MSNNSDTTNSGGNILFRSRVNTYTRKHARAHTQTHARTYARKHARTHTHSSCILPFYMPRVSVNVSNDVSTAATADFTSGSIILTQHALVKADTERGYYHRCLLCDHYFTGNMRRKISSEMRHMVRFYDKAFMMTTSVHQQAELYNNNNNIYNTSIALRFSGDPSSAAHQNKRG